MEFDDLINEKCCACGKIIGDHGGHINGVMLNRRAQWKYPVAGNIITGEKGKAVAIICDECFDKQKPVKHAVRFERSKIIYIPIEDLEVVDTDR